MVAFIEELPSSSPKKKKGGAVWWGCHTSTHPFFLASHGRMNWNVPSALVALIRTVLKNINALRSYKEFVMTSSSTRWAALEKTALGFYWCLSHTRTHTHSHKHTDAQTFALSRDKKHVFVVFPATQSHKWKPLQCTFLFFILLVDKWKFCFNLRRRCLSQAPCTRSNKAGNRNGIKDEPKLFNGDALNT